MEFSESFFHSSSGSEDEESKAEPPENAKVLYSPKICEPKVRKTSDARFHGALTTYILCMQWFLASPSAAGDSLESGSIHGLEFAVCKHKADLLYYQGGYREAAGLYGKLLAVVPASNTCVTREVRDGLARCHFKLREAKLARKEAEMLVRLAKPCTSLEIPCQTGRHSHPCARWEDAK